MEEDEDDDESLYNSKPTEEMIEEMEEKLDTAQSELKNLFLIIFQVLYITWFNENVVHIYLKTLSGHKSWSSFFSKRRVFIINVCGR